MDLGTTYLGMRLPHPLIIGAGPLGDDLDRVRHLEDAGAAMLVLRSLYEEEITGEQMDAFLHTESHTESFAEAGTYAPEPLLALGPEEYLEHLRLVKAAVRIPVVASLNGVTPGGWTSYAKLCEEAGADALELHVYHAASDMTLGAAEVERRAIDIVREVKRTLRIPVAVKLAPLLTAFAHFAKALDTAGVDGLVLFTRFHRIDIDVEEFEVVRSLPLSDSSERARHHRWRAHRPRRDQGHDGRRARDPAGLDPAAARPRPPAHRAPGDRGVDDGARVGVAPRDAGQHEPRAPPRSGRVRTRQLPHGPALKLTSRAAGRWRRARGSTGGRRDRSASAPRRRAGSARG